MKNIIHLLSFIAFLLFIPNLLFAKKKKKTVAKRATNILSVKQFGAKGNGVNDDTKSIQNCLDASINKGGTVYFEIGNYNISETLHLKCKNNIIIDGNNATIHYVNSNISLNVDGDPSYINSSSIEVKNLHIKGNLNTGNISKLIDKSSGGVGIFISDVNNINIHNNQIENVYGQGIQVHNNATWNNGFAKQLDNVTVSNNKILNTFGNNRFHEMINGQLSSYDNYGDGICFDGVLNGQISNNIIYNNLFLFKCLGRGGIVLEVATEGCTISNNYIMGYDRNIHIENTYGNHIIEKNTLKGSDIGIIISSSSIHPNKVKPIKLLNNYISNDSMPNNIDIHKILQPRGLVYFYSNTNGLDNSIVSGNTIKMNENVNFSSYNFIFLSQQANLIISNNNFEGINKYDPVFYLPLGANSIINNTFKNLAYLDINNNIKFSEKNKLVNTSSNTKL